MKREKRKQVRGQEKRKIGKRERENESAES